MVPCACGSPNYHYNSELNMPKRKTSRVRRKQKRRPQVLELRVISRRIVWIEVADWIKKLFKLALVGAAVAGLVWAIGLGLRRAFLDNGDFRISLVDLNENPVMDELRLIELGGIDLNGSIFQIDVSELEDRLAGLPELAMAKVERELPGTLRVRVGARVPVAWIEVPDHGLNGGDSSGGLLVDPNGVLFPCRGMMSESAAGLPVIVVTDPGPLQPQAGELCKEEELHRGLAMLRLAGEIRGMDGVGIARVEQANEWSILVTTACGIEATLGLGDHRRQFTDLVTAHEHAGTKGYQIATIDLIPELNIPITLSSAPPPRAIPVPEPENEPAAPSRQRQDLEALLNRS